jgi:hypothetical protein
MGKLIKPYRILLTTIKASIDVAEAVAGSIILFQYELRIMAVKCLEELQQREDIINWQKVETYMDEIQDILDANQAEKQPKFESGEIMSPHGRYTGEELVINPKKDILDDFANFRPHF